MAKYRKRPIVVEAVQWFPGATITAVQYDQGIPFDVSLAFVMTRRGKRIWLRPGDWVIPEPGGLYGDVLKPDVFAADYEPASGAPDDSPDSTKRLRAVSTKLRPVSVRL